MSTFLAVQMAISNARHQLQVNGVRPHHVGIAIELPIEEWKNFLQSAEIGHHVNFQSSKFNGDEVTLMGAVVRVKK